MVACQEKARRCTQSGGMAVIALPRGVDRHRSRVLRLADAVLDGISKLTRAVVRRLAPGR